MNLMDVKADGIIAWFSYNALNIAAIMVIAGVCMALIPPLKKHAGKSRAKIHL